MTDQIESLLLSIGGGAAVLDPTSLDEAVREAGTTGRVEEVASALAAKPAPKIPPRYESEIRTLLSRVYGSAGEPGASRIQAYAAVHLDPHNADAIVSLDDACVAIGDDVRTATWSALVHSYPDVPPIRAAASSARIGVLPPAKQQRRGERRKKRSPMEAVLVDATAEPDQIVDKKGRRRRGKRQRGQAWASIVPACEPDPVRADRLAVLHIALSNSWNDDPTAAPSELDPLSWAARVMRGESVDPPKQASGAKACVDILTGRGDESNTDLYARVTKRVRAHPAVLAWIARRQLAIGDVPSARETVGRLDEPVPAAYAGDFDEIQKNFALAGDDLAVGWSAWQDGSFPANLRGEFARSLLAAGRDADADEVLGLPEIDAIAIADEQILHLRFDIMRADGDFDGAICQIDRLIEVADNPTEYVAFGWIALAEAGRWDVLVERIQTDSERDGVDIEAVTRTVAAELGQRLAVAVSQLVDAMASVRSNIQLLAKGRTIRDTDVFAATADEAKASLETLQKSVSALDDIGEGAYPIGDETLIRLIAAAHGRPTRRDDDTIIVGPSVVDAEVLRSGIPDLITASVREFADGAGRLGELIDAAAADVATSVAESQRTDLARRRLEERVSKLARAGAGRLDEAIEMLSARADK